MPRVIHTAQALVDAVMEVPGLPARGGNVMATIICPNHRPQMSTVRPGVMKPLAADDSRKGEIRKLKIGLKPEDLKVLIRETIVEAGHKIDLAEAEIIVAGGRGVGGKSQFGLIEELATAVGGQIGATVGRRLAPNLLRAVIAVVGLTALVALLV